MFLYQESEEDRKLLDYLFKYREVDPCDESDYLWESVNRLMGERDGYRAMLEYCAGELTRYKYD